MTTATIQRISAFVNSQPSVQQNILQNSVSTIQEYADYAQQLNKQAVGEFQGQLTQAYQTGMNVLGAVQHTSDEIVQAPVRLAQAEASAVKSGIASGADWALRRYNATVQNTSGAVQNVLRTASAEYRADVSATSNAARNAIGAADTTIDSAIRKGENILTGGAMTIVVIGVVAVGALWLLTRK